MNRKKIVYSLNIEDIQEVANEDLGRDLTEKEIELVANELPGYIDWTTAITHAMFEVGLKEEDD